MLIPFINFRILDLLDIILVALVFYRLIILIRGTKAVQLIQGLAVIFAASTLSNWLGLYTVNWLLRNTITVVLVALPVVFQPELRRALEQLGRGKLLTEPLPFLGRDDLDGIKTMEEIIEAVTSLAKSQTGALIVLERKTGLKDIIETGITMDALISAQLLENIFYPNTPLHDGALIIRGNRIVAAGCYLPLTENPSLGKKLGTRHRAALGISEDTDALVLIVSEETGIISLARGGKLERYLDKQSLRDILQDIYQPKSSLAFYFRNRKESNDE